MAAHRNPRSYGHKEILSAVSWCLTLSANPCSERKCLSLGGGLRYLQNDIDVGWRSQTGGVPKCCSTADSHGGGLKDCFAKTQLLAFTERTFDLKPRGTQTS